MPPGPFADLLVVEIGQYVVAPVAAMQLALGGARVIKVEPIQGDNYRRASPVAPMESRHFLIKNRSKESVSLKIGSAGADDILRRLFERADVVLTNLSPRALTSHHLDYDSVRSANPRVVYGTVSGFGHIGPEAELPGMDVTAQARSGLLYALGAEADGVPLHSEVQVADYATSLLLLAGVSAALFARERTGEGQRVEVSLLAGALFVQANAIHHLYESDGWRERFTTEELPRLRGEGASPAEIDEVRNAMRPDKGIRPDSYRVVRTANGSVAVGAASPQARRKFLAILGLEDDNQDLTKKIDEALVARTTDYWVEEMTTAGIPVAEVRHVEEMLFDEHVFAEGLVVDVEHETVGRYRTLGAPIRLSETPFSAGGPSPSFAHDTRSVLLELGYTVDDVNRLTDDGAIFDGSGGS